MNDMRLRVYLDTSVISYLQQEDVPDRMQIHLSFEDSQHIAVALYNNCDVIISWNFKHLVNIKTIQGIRKITQLKGYRDIEIITPTTLLEMEV